MKKLLLAIILLPAFCFSQTMLPRQTGTNGVSDNNLRVLVTFSLPAASTAPTSTFYRGGSLRYNTVTSKVEFYNGSIWVAGLIASDLTGYVPTTRTITINGTALDLSANRSFSVGTVTSITPGYGHTSNTPITTSGTMTLDTSLIRTVLNSFTKAQSDLRFGGLNANNIWFGTNDYRAQAYFKFGAYFYDLNSGFRTQIAMSNKLTADRIIDFPDKAGTLLVTSDLTGYAQIAGINAFTNRNTFTTNDAVNATATFTNSAVNGVALNIAGGQSLFNGPVALNSSVLSIGQFAHSSSSTILLAQGAQFRFNNAAATFYQNFTWANATANRAINWRDKGGDVAFLDEIPTQLRLTGSGTGAATTISIAHGLTGVTSSSIAIAQPINAASAGISYITTDATNINIVYAVAPLLGTNNLSYNVSIKP